MKTTSRAVRVLGLAVAAVGLTQASASAQAFDASIANIEVNQGLPNVSLTAGRSTFIRVEAALVSPPSNPVDLDGIMRVYVNGVEAPDSPVYSRNGPYPAKPNPNLNVRDGTLNFMYLPPASNNVVFEVELNPAGPNFVPEGNLANNIASTPALDFNNRSVVEFAYVPVDYRPSGGGTPNLPDEALIEPGVGDNFIQGIYPGKDIYYHRVNAPSKLWTSSLSGTGSSLLNSMLADLAMTNPDPDFYYAWVPGSLPYNGQAFLNSPVSMGNTQNIRHQRTYAHEVGHNTGLSHTSWAINDIGVDMEHHLNITEGLPFIKVATLRNIMDAGLLTDEAWVRNTHYEHFYSHPKFTAPSPPAPGAPALLITGLWDPSTRSTTLDHVLAVPPSQPTDSVVQSQADFEIRAYRGADLAQSLFVTSPTVMDSCEDEAPESPESPESLGKAGTDSNQAPRELAFHAFLPSAGQSFDRLVITPMGRAKGEPLVLDRSANVPELQLLSPGPDGVLADNLVTLSWGAFDADGDDLRFYLRYTHDGSTFTALASGITETEWTVDMRDLPAFSDGVGYFELFASDGLNTATLRSPTLVGGATYAAVVNPPWVHISTPDSGKSYDRAATVILHAQAWDIEDRELEGPELVWTSNLDGPIGTGRLTSTASLSVGTHVLTVTGTDSNGFMTSDTTVVTIDDRGLPGELISNYCTPGTSASGCQATLSAVGTPSATAATGFTVTASTVEGIKDGLFFFGTSGRQANTWGSGTSYQCVVPPTLRTTVIAGTGTLGACDGSASRDMNATWNAIPAKNPGAGAVAQLQFWYRDPQNTSNQTTSLSDALEFTVQP